MSTINESSNNIVISQKSKTKKPNLFRDWTITVADDFNKSNRLLKDFLKIARFANLL